MAPIPMKRVVSVSSEDELSPASNLLGRGSGRKWLTAPGEKARRAEVVVELCKRARIHRLEISNFGSAFIEIHVSSSSTASGGGGEWLTLLPSCMLMTVSDSRAGRNKTSSLVCSRERFSATAAGLKWSQLKLICRQPYNLSSQFGLQHVAFCSELGPPPSPSPQPHPSPSHTPRDTPNQSIPHKLPSLPSPATPCKPGDPNSSRTPHRKSGASKQPLGESNSEEFSGLERQSRLLRNALKSPRDAPANLNPILVRAVEEQEAAKKTKSFEESYEKKRLLVGELAKAQGKTDFAAGYGKPPSSVEMTAAFRRMSRLDNRCELGQEEERRPWGKSRRKARGRGRRDEGGGKEEEAWVTRRKKKLRGMIKDCQRVLSQAGTAGGTSGRPEDLSTADDDDDDETTPTKPKPSVSEGTTDSDSDATIIMDDPPPPPIIPPPPLQLILADEPPFVPCPLCGQSFPAYAIELHAAGCGDSLSPPTAPISID